MSCNQSESSTVPMVTAIVVRTHMMRMIAILSFIGIIFVMIVAIGNTGQCLPSRPGEKLSDIDEKKFCVYKNNTVVSSTTHSVMSTTTTSATSKSSMVPSPRPNNEVKMTFGFYDDDISSLSNEDVSQWAWSNMKRGVDYFCVKKTSIKLTVPEKDVNQLSRDLVSLQYQVMNE